MAAQALSAPEARAQHGHLRHQLRVEAQQLGVEQRQQVAAAQVAVQAIQLQLPREVDGSVFPCLGVH